MELISQEKLDEYPNIDEHEDEKKLIEAIEKDKLIVFFGAGVSKLGGCASWEELAQNIIKDIPNSIFSELEKVVLKEMSSTDQKKCISICHAVLKKDKKILDDYFFKPILNSIEPNDSDGFVRIHDLLFGLNAKCYVTTNIDKGFERISDKLRSDRIEHIDLTNYNKKTNTRNLIRNGNIFYLHGIKDNIYKSIFTHESYLNFYRKEYIRDFLFEIFSNEYTVLFVGYGLNDYEILQNIFYSIHKEDRDYQNKIEHYLLTPIYSRDFSKYKVEKEYLEIFSIKSLPYFIDYDGYTKLYTVLERLITIIRNRQTNIIEFDKSIQILEL